MIDKLRLFFQRLVMWLALAFGMFLGVFMLGIFSVGTGNIGDKIGALTYYIVMFILSVQAWKAICKRPEHCSNCRQLNMPSYMDGEPPKCRLCKRYIERMRDALRKDS